MSLWLDVSHWSFFLPQVFPGGRHCLEHHAPWLESGVWAAASSHARRPGPVQSVSEGEGSLAGPLWGPWERCVLWALAPGPASDGEKIALPIRVQREPELSVHNGCCSAWALLTGGKSFRDVLPSLWTGKSHHLHQGQGWISESETEEMLKNPGARARYGQGTLVGEEVGQE